MSACHFFFSSYGNHAICNEAGIYKRNYNSAGNDDIRISERLNHQRRAIFHARILFWAPFHAIDCSQISILMDIDITRKFFILFSSI